MLWSDNGKNFIVASAELVCSFQETDPKKIADFLGENGGDWTMWKRNLPVASNIGGVWEQQIRSAQSILNSLLKTHGSNLTKESLQPVVVEVKAIVSSAPLKTEVVNSVTSLAPLSRINLLLMKSRVVMSPPHNVHWGINLPSKTPPPLSCQAPPPPPPPLKPTNCPSRLP